MSDDSQQPIVVKRIRKGGGGHHGGAWKIAYADFVTAMMAFFLLMWLLGSTAKGDLDGIAEYFQTPLKVALQGGVGSGDASSVIKGGGQDLTRAVGQVKRGASEDKKSVQLQAQRGEYDNAEMQRLQELKARIEAMINANPTLAQYRNQLLLDITDEGLRIQIVDEQNRPMFDLSSSELKPYARDILREVGRAMNGVDHRVSLSGHTDATPFAGGDRGFSNWELSALRANASRRELIAGGMDEAKVVRVVGLASTMLFDKTNPHNPVNRRISIIVMNRKTEEAVLREGAGVTLGSDTRIEAKDLAPPPAVPRPGAPARPTGLGTAPPPPPRSAPQ